MNDEHEQMSLDRERDHDQRFSNFEDSLIPGHRVTSHYTDDADKRWEQMQDSFAKSSKPSWDH